MCRKNVILFNCGHTRKLNITPCNISGVECANPERILIPEGGGIGIEAPIDKVKWSCVFKYVPGRAAHDPLIDMARENANAVKAEIDHKIEVLSVLSTPFATPGSERSGFNWPKSITPRIERGGFNFDQRFAKSVSRRLQSIPNTPEARDDLTFSFTNMNLRIPSGKFKEKTAGIKEEKEDAA